MIDFFGIKALADTAKKTHKMRADHKDKFLAQSKKNTELLVRLLTKKRKK